MSKHIPKPANTSPRNLRLSLLHNRSEFLGCFANSLKTSFNCISRLDVEISSRSDSGDISPDSIDVRNYVVEPLDRHIRRHTPPELPRLDAHADATDLSLQRLRRVRRSIPDRPLRRRMQKNLAQAQELGRRANRHRCPSDRRRAQPIQKPRRAELRAPEVVIRGREAGRGCLPAKT